MAAAQRQPCLRHPAHRRAGDRPVSSLMGFLLVCTHAENNVLGFELELPGV